MLSYLASTHDLTKRSTIFVELDLFEKLKLQLTTSRRGRRFSISNLTANSVLQLTTSRRGRLISLISIILLLTASTHDLTKRSTINFMTIFSFLFCFNSRPHEEVDIPGQLTLRISRASTHDLTKRSTLSWRQLCFLLLASTHDLTKRSTIAPLPGSSRRHCFNSRPHEEVDIFFQFGRRNAYASTHDLTKRSTNWKR